MPTAPLLIALTGTEKAGKSTLANALAAAARRRGWTYHYEHGGYRFQDRMSTYHAALLWRSLTSGARVAVIDRWWPDEEVYARVYRGGTRWPQSGRMLDRVFLRYGGVYLVCTPTRSELAGKRGHEDGLYPTKNSLVCDYYHDLLQKHPGTNLYHPDDYGYTRRHSLAHYDRDEVEGWLAVDEYAEDLLDAMAEWRDLATRASPDLFDPRSYNLAGNVQGSPDGDPATVVLVGERSNPKLRGGRLAWPFFEHGNSSLYLARALQLLDVPETRLAWFNAWDAGSEAALAVLTRCAPRRFVALGREAERWLKVRKVEYRGVPHPQHARRFHHHDLSSYAAAIKEAISP
jgi:hypothetical protein